MRGSVRAGLLGVATALSLMAGTAYAVPGVTHSAYAEGEPAARVAQPPKAAGFVPVRTLAGGVSAAVSPAKGELWLLRHDDQGAALDHLKGTTWTTERVPGADTGRPSMAATARDDVWLSLGGTLRRYDGRRWSEVALPKGRDGSARSAGPVASGRRGTAYVVLTGGDFGGQTHLFRFGQGRWTDLGAPPTGTTYYTLIQVVAAGDTVSVVSQGMRAIEVYDHVDGVWSGPTGLIHNGGGSYGHLGALLVTAGQRRLAVGGQGFTGLEPMCREWISTTAQKACTTTVVAGAADRLKNGSIVIGGEDYRTPSAPPRPGHPRSVEGTFALRGADGTERALSGDPGEETVLLVAERNQNAAWAVTRDSSAAGPVYTLQRYDG